VVFLLGSPFRTEIGHDWGEVRVIQFGDLARAESPDPEFVAVIAPVTAPHFPGFTAVLIVMDVHQPVAVWPMFGEPKSVAEVGNRSRYEVGNRYEVGYEVGGSREQVRVRREVGNRYG